MLLAIPNLSLASMATHSEYAPIDIPNIDVWNLLFERQTEFPGSKGILFNIFSSSKISGFAAVSITQRFSGGLKILRTQNSIPYLPEHD